MNREPENQEILELDSEPVEDQTMGPYRDVYLQQLMERKAVREQEAAAQTSDEVIETASAPVWEVPADDAESENKARSSRKALLLKELQDKS